MNLNLSVNFMNDTLKCQLKRISFSGDKVTFSIGITNGMMIYPNLVWRVITKTYDLLRSIDLVAWTGNKNHLGLLPAVKLEAQ